MEVHSATRESLQRGYRHEAFLYAGQEEFLEGATSFIRAGLAAAEPVMVAVEAEKLEVLRSRLDGQVDHVHFVDLSRVGANPARIIAIWRDFLEDHSQPGRASRGIGEPIWPGRSRDELVECHRHESLLNLEFGDADGFWLLCPYDTQRLDPVVIEEAERTHPFVLDDGGSRASTAYGGIEAAAAPFAHPLREPAAPVCEFEFDLGSLGALRTFVSKHASGAGLAPARVGELLVAVTEVAGNSVRHGGGQGKVRSWREGDALIYEVRDGGRIDDPLVGRRRPIPGQQSNFGLWLANQFCDLVQVRSLADETVVRLHVRGAPAAAE